MEKMINEILYPTVAIQEGFLNRRTIKGQIPSQIWRGLQTCQEKGIQCMPGNEIRLPNCTNTKCTIENILACRRWRYQGLLVYLILKIMVPNTFLCSQRPFHFGVYLIVLWGPFLVLIQTQCGLGFS